MGHIELTNENFDNEITKHTGLALVDFWAEWCMPCLKIAPIVDDIGKEFEGKVKTAKLNVDHAGDAAARFGIKSIPTVILFKDGKPVEQIIGVQPKATLVKMIEANL